MSATPTCRLVTLGCKVNQYETQLVREALLQSGYREAIEGEAADLCVVNTCTVTNTGDSKSRQVIRQLSRQNPAGKTIVMGCYATRDPEAVAKLPNVIEVISDKRELPDVLARFGVSTLPAGITDFEGRQRAFIKIQDGCILKCSYCIIPTVRPGLRSRRAVDIEDEVRALIDHGYREIVISGIHMGHYGVDTNNLPAGDPPARLWHLLRRLDRIPGYWRMRLSSIEAVEVNDEFIRACGDCEHLCPQFHPALQSGSDSVLTRMHRRYRVQRFLDRLAQIREVLGPATAFSTDVIVGFPGETESEFQQTLDTCRAARFMKVHVFPFSRRDGTPAATMPNQIPAEEIRRRVTVLSELERDLAHQYYSERVADSAHLEVLAERLVDGRTDLIRGTDRWYMPVECPGTAADLGQFIRCRAVAADRQGVTAERLEPERTAAPETVRLQSWSELSEESEEPEASEESCQSSGGSMLLPVLEISAPSSGVLSSFAAPGAI
ncbi:MAG: Threonylcarbamoyladenosine tRNA methylthiotransferase MtaB [Planctomycetota bacterium]|jgi:threonylcarbamoyladenosine tRNA methylthiotransferase MtaB